MQLVPRDLQILETVGEYGTVDTAILHQLHFPNDNTGRACQNRLKKMADASLLKAVRLIASDGGQQSGSLPTLWFLTDTGAELVASETGVYPRRVTRSEPKPFTLRHRLDIVRARIAIDRAAELATIATPHWIMEQDTSSRSKAIKGRSPTENRILSDRYYDEDNDRTITFRPDAAFHLQVPRPSGNGTKTLLGYVELDRSTEGHLQWQRKLWGIEAFLADTIGWRKHWPKVIDPAVVVFVLCKSRQRLANLAETTKPSKAAARIRLSTYPLDPRTALTSDVWEDCQGQLFTVIKGR